ncbi:MAG: hypothetical protein AB1505_09630 [Candidatus Latescibacterota bacterium]
MRRANLLLSVGICLAAAELSLATPSTQIWVPSTDVQPYGTLHLGIDNYTTVLREARHGGHDFATDYGLTLGALRLGPVQGEVGVDLFEPTDDPLSFHAKLALPQGALGRHAPAMAVGGFGFGTQTKDEAPRTDYNILYALAAESLHPVGRLSAGYYWGNGEVLVDARGREGSRGLLLSWDRTVPEISDKLWLAVDYQSGPNAFGATSLGGAWSFAPNVSLIVGYVLLGEEALSGKDLWTTQLDVNF